MSTVLLSVVRGSDDNDKLQHDLRGILRKFGKVDVKPAWNLPLAYNRARFTAYYEKAISDSTILDINKINMNGDRIHAHRPSCRLPYVDESYSWVSEAVLSVFAAAVICWLIYLIWSFYWRSDLTHSLVRSLQTKIVVDAPNDKRDMLLQFWIQLASLRLDALNQCVKQLDLLKSQHSFKSVSTLPEISQKYMEKTQITIAEGHLMLNEIEKVICLCFTTIQNDGTSAVGMAMSAVYQKQLELDQVEACKVGAEFSLVKPTTELIPYNSQQSTRDLARVKLICFTTFGIPDPYTQPNRD